MERDKTNQKVALVSFILAAVLAHFVVGVAMVTIGGVFPPFERIRTLDMVQHGAPLFVAFALFAYLQFSPKVKTWAEEVIIEVRKIVWPSQKDTVAMTTVVCVMVVIAGMGLALIDYASSVLMKVLVNG